MTWFNNSYLYKKQITIDHTKVSGGSNLSSFPVLISRTDANLKTVANAGHVQNSSGFDIIFTDSTETTKLDHEIETYTATTGAIVMWVRVPTLSASVDTVVYMYYGNSSISTSQENATGVWDTNYKGVWHFKDGTTLSLTDSTSNAVTLTNNSATATSGQIDGGINCSGAAQYATASLDGTAFTQATMEAWINAASTGGPVGVFSWQPPATPLSGTPFWHWEFNTTLQIYFDSNFRLTYSASTSTWYHVVTTWNTSNTLTLYINGVSQGTYTTTGGATPTLLANANAVYFGAGYNGYYNGKLDEGRVSNVARSSGWITTSYNSQNSPSTFYSVGSELVSAVTKTANIRTRLAVKVTKSFGMRFLQRVQATKSVGMRLLERVQKTVSTGVRTRLRQTNTRTSALRFRYQTIAFTKSVGMRLLQRVTKTVSAPLRARIATQKTVSSPARVRVRVTNTSNLAVRLRYQTIPFTRSVGVRFLERVQKTVSAPLRSRIAVQSTRTVALRLRERVQQTRTMAIRTRLNIQRTFSSTVRTRLAQMNTSSVPLRLLLQGGTLASRYVSVRLRERVTTQTSAPLRFLYRTIFDMLKVKAWDTFYRANQSGWGTASDGVDTWSFAGAAYTSSIVSNEGQLTGTTGIGVGILGANTIADGTAVVGLNASAPATDEIGVILRYTDTSNYYVGKVTNGHLFLSQIVAGTPTNLTNTVITFAATTPYWLRFYVAGNKLKARFWSKDVAEPGTWTIITSSSLTGAHQYGLYYNAASASNTVLFDNFEVDFSTRAITNPVRLILQAGNTVLAPVRALLSVKRTLTTQLRARLQVSRTLTSAVRLRYQTIPFTRSVGMRFLERVQRSVSTGVRTRLRQPVTRSAPIRALVRVLSTASVGVRARMAALSTKIAPIRTRLAVTATRSIQARLRLNVARSLSTSVRTRLTARVTVYALVRTRVRVLTTVVAPIRFVYQTITTTRSVGMRLRERVTQTAIAPLRARMAQLTTRSTGMRTRVSVLLSDATGVRTRIAARNTRVATVRGKVRVLATVSAPMRFVYQTLHTTRSVSVRLVMRGATSIARLRLLLSSGTHVVMPLRLRIGLRSTPATGVRLVLFVPPTNIVMRVRSGKINMKVREP